MARKGVYTRKVGPITKVKRNIRRFGRWFKKLSWPKKILLIGGPIVAVLIIIPIATYLYYLNDISDPERLMNRNNTGIVLTDKNGEVFYSFGKAEGRDMSPLDEISDNVKEALIAAEDKDFYNHPGFSIGRTLATLYANVTAGEITGGGSTITQQLAKNTLLTEDQTIFRKYQELAISLAIEQQYTKDEILSMYLNSVFYGENSFGIKEAAETYFGKAPKDLNLAESAMLIGILPAPSVYSPITGNPEYAKERQETVLSRMVENEYITEQEMDAALAVQLTYADQSQQNSEAPHFAEMVIEQLYEEYGQEKVIRSGYQVETTLDLNLQRILKAKIDGHISYIQLNGGSNAGGVAIDPTSGEVRALVGSADWENPDWGMVNMATTPRQPGSSFKPIYYSEALAEGIITPATMIADVPTDFGGYAPQNASRTFSGDISVRNALARSLNIPAVKVMEQLGIEKSIEAAQRMGITAVDDESDYGLSLALGTAEVPLLQMTNAYAGFANGGQQYTSTIIKKINNKFNDTIFTAREEPREVLSQQGAFLISSILSDNNARAPIFGSSLTVWGRTAAVKTGTTEESRDAWTIGYTPQLVVGVWVGNNDNTPMLNGGSGMAGPIWVNTLSEALQGVADTPFAVPSGVIERPVCFGNGGLADRVGPNTYNEYFLSWALPTTTCTAAQEQQEEEKQPEEEPQTNENDQNNDDTSGDTGNEDDTEQPPVDDGEGDGTGDGGDDGGVLPDPGNSGGNGPLNP
jgi:1A family penicillin-binding protein